MHRFPDAYKVLKIAFRWMGMEIALLCDVPNIRFLHLNPLSEHECIVLLAHHSGGETLQKELREKMMTFSMGHNHVRADAEPSLRVQQLFLDSSLVEDRIGRTTQKRCANASG